MLIKPFSYLQQKVSGPVGPPTINQTNLLVWLDANFPGTSPSTTWEDLSGNGNDMTVTSAGTGTNPTLTSTIDEAYYQLTGVYSNPGSSTFQTGGGFFIRATAPFATTTPDLTITVWLYPDLNDSQSWTVGRWVSAGTGGNPGTRLFYGNYATSTNFGYGSTTYNPSPNINPTQSIWQEFTVTFDHGAGTNGVVYYRNGSQYAIGSSGGGSLTLSKPLHIGKQYDAVSEYFSGRMAMVFIYDRVLNSTEVLSNYNAVTARYNY